ncbi:DUF2637 domain-containing protein [Allorhizocola rhizosphaerae]|uniref:DUF2637 domain-containing protein n=1 Tax=Allorhizocola rhizosphaerae TaxID=1872709 RepID=UPI000E3EB9DF|nr:DUF2637 domain-containing protein [Allorhizocola rhizosphaerae]
MDLGQLTSTWVPTWVMVLVVSVLTLSLFIGVPLARSAGRRRGHRLAHPEAFATMREKAKDTALFLAALIPSLLVWLAVMGVSFIGLTGFAADVMQWQHWTNILVPLSLDGISVSFGAWAFVAVKRGRHPGRAYKIVLAAATMSAVLNFVHGRDRWSIWAGAYLAFLSLAGMAMFHELLDQFMAAYDDEVALKTRYPRFGQRWIYAPVSTFAARRAWIVHPPEEALRPTVRNALDHLQAVRDAKRQRRLDGALHVREEQQAKLLEVQAKAEVRRAKATAGRRGGDVPHRSILVPAQPLPPQQPQPQPQPEPQAPALTSPPPPPPPPPSVQGTVLDPDTRSQIASVLSTNTSAREVLGRRPMAEQRRGDDTVNNTTTNGRDAIGRKPLSTQRSEETQRMIAEAIAMGEDVQPEAVMDWVQRQFGGQRPSYTWARDQILTVRSRDAVGLDADLV